MSSLNEFKIKGADKFQKNRIERRKFNYQKFFHSTGEKNHDFSHIGGDPTICYNHKGKYIDYAWFTGDAGENDLQISMKNINRLPKTFKIGGNNINGWIKKKCGCHWGRHPNGARRGNVKRNKTTKGKNKTGRGKSNYD